MGIRVSTEAWIDIQLPPLAQANIPRADVLPGDDAPADNTPGDSSQGFTHQTIYHPGGLSAPDMPASNYHLADQADWAKMPGTEDSEPRQDHPDRHDSGQDKDKSQSTSCNGKTPPMNGNTPPDDPGNLVDAAATTGRVEYAFEPGSRFRAFSAP